MERAEAEAVYEQGRETVVAVLLELSAQNALLRREVADLRERVAQQEERIAELERRLNRNSRNSSLPPLRLHPGVLRARIRRCRFARLRSAMAKGRRAPMRAIGIDVHRDFCEVAISEGGRLRSAGRVPSTPEALELLGASLSDDDEVALEATGNALAIARILEGHVARVVVASARELHAISGAKAKTDRRDARTLAKLLAAGMFAGTWLPGEEVRALRRRLAQRARTSWARSRLKNEVQAALMRNLVGAPSATDLFGAAGRRWLADLVLPADERETLDSCLRTIAFLDGEVERFEVAIARYAMHSVEIRRLVTIPGVGLISAATLVAVVDDVHRFRSARKLVGYLGLDPRVRQSGSSPARMGHISKEGPAAARQALCEAAHAAMRTPGPLRGRPRRVLGGRQQDPLWR